MKAIFFYVLATLFILCSCTQSPDNQIMGKWISEDGKGEFLFADENKVILITNGQTAHGEFHLDGNQIHFLFRNGNSLTMQIQLTDKQLVLDNEKYTRK